MTNTVVGTQIRSDFWNDETIGTITAVETHDPDGFELAESMIWVQWPDIDQPELLTWDDVRPV